MVESDTIKALECHIKRQCWNDCPNATEERQLLNRPCSSMIAEDALDLINRKQAVNELQAKQIVKLKIKVEQQKAEIEQWKEEANKYQTMWCEAVNDIQTAQAEAIKEFENNN